MAAKKKGAKKKAATKKRMPQKRQEPQLLSADERKSKIRAGADADELADAFNEGWSQVANRLRVPGVTPAGLSAQVRRMLAAAKRESDLATKQAAKLAPLTDRRIAEGDATMRMLLRASRIMRAVAADDPAVARAFERFDGLWTKRYPGGAPRAGEDGGGTE